MRITSFGQYAQTNCDACKGTGVLMGYSFLHMCSCIRHPQADADCRNCGGRGFYDDGGTYGPSYDVCRCLTAQIGLE